MNDINLTFFGSPQIQVSGLLVEPDTRKATALLAYLAVMGESHTRDTLANLLWPDYPDQGAKGALRRTLSTIRKALGEGAIVTFKDQIKLGESVVSHTDVNKFRKKIQDAHNHNHQMDVNCPICLAHLEEAVQYYRGDFLEGFTLRDSQNFDEWQFYQSERFRSAYAGVMEKLSRGYRGTGDLDLAIEYAQRWLALDPLVEAAHREIMLIYYQMGNRSAALRQYRECARVLDEELGVGPLEKTMELYHQILEDKVLTERPTTLAASELPIEKVLSEPAKNEAYPLIGRDKEWALLKELLLRKPGGKFLAVTGEAGIGKTRLVEDFFAYCRAAGHKTVTARCFDGESELAYAPFVQILNALLSQPDRRERVKTLSGHWLREVARLVPEIAAWVPDLPAPLPISAGGQSLFFEGLRQVLFALSDPNAPLAVFIDDLHLADQATTDFLSYLVRRFESTPMLVIGAWGSNAAMPDQRLRQLSMELIRNGSGTVLHLERLTPSDVQHFVDYLTDIPFDQNFSERLYQETEGIPFFLVEYVTMLVRDGAIDHHASWIMPDRVQDLLRTVLDNLQEAERQLIQTAAVIGRSFDYEIIFAASGRSEVEVVQAVEALIAKGLIRERNRDVGFGELIFDFNHEKLHHMVLSDTSQARLRLLHRRVAETLTQKSFSERQRQLTASQVASHYKKAGALEDAARYYKLAGDYAFSVFANREALDHFQAALSLHHPERKELLERIGDLHVLNGNYREAMHSLETALALSHDVPDLIRIERKIGELHDRRGDWTLAEKHFESALEVLENGECESERALLYATWSRTAFHQGNYDHSMELASRALDLIHEGTDTEVHSLVHNILGILYRRLGDYDQAYLHLMESLKEQADTSNPFRKLAALNNLGLVLIDRAETEMAVQVFQEALQLCEQTGDRHRAAAVNNNLADLYNAVGKKDLAMLHLRQAVILFAEVGNEDEDTRPEIWMLTEW